MAIRVTQAGLFVASITDSDARATQAGLFSAAVTDSDARVTQAGLSAAITFDENVRATDVFRTVAVSLSAPPVTPTLSHVSVGGTWWWVESSEFVSTIAATAKLSQYQVDNSSDLSSPLSTLTFGNTTEEPFSITAQFIGLQPASTYYGRVRHQDSLNTWSAWSAIISQVTSTAPLPVQPTLTGTPSDDSVTLLGSTYDHQAGKGGSTAFLFPHTASDWEIGVSGASTFTSLIWSSTGDFANLETILSAAVLTPSNTYPARVRYMDDQGIFSAWSPTYTFNTLATPVDAPGKPTVTVPSSGISQRSATVETSSYTHPSAEAHDATWWLITTSSGFTPVEIQEVSTSQLESWTSTLMDFTPNSTLWARARWRDASGDYGAWADAVSFVTPDDPPFALISTPQDIGVVSTGSTGITLAATLSGALSTGNTVTFQVRALNSTAWTTLQDTTASSVAWDTSTKSGVQEVKVFVSDAGGNQAQASYTAVYVNSTGTTVYENQRADVTPGTDLDQQGYLYQWEHANRHASAGAYYADGGILSAGTGSVSFVYARQEIQSPVTVTGISKNMIAGFESGIVGLVGTTWDMELNRGGHGLMTSGRSGVTGESDISPISGWGIAVGGFPSWPFGGIGTRGIIDGELMSLARNVTGGDRVFKVTIGDIQGLIRDFHSPSRGGPLPQPFYTVISQFTPTIINGDGTFDGTLQAKVIGPYQEPEDWQMEETLTGLAFGCANCGYFHFVDTHFWGQPFQVFNGNVFAVSQTIECVTQGCPQTEFPVTVSGVTQTAATFTGPST